MSTITINRNNKTYTFTEGTNPVGDIDTLVRLAVRIGDMTSWSMYVGEDPDKLWNQAVSDAAQSVWDKIDALEAA